MPASNLNLPRVDAIKLSTRWRSLPTRQKPSWSQSLAHRLEGQSFDHLVSTGWYLLAHKRSLASILNRILLTIRVYVGSDKSLMLHKVASGDSVARLHVVSSALV